MKKSLLALCCIFVSMVYGQPIKNGIYVTNKKNCGFVTEYFHFSDGNAFKYINLGCGGSGFGIGQYEIKNDSVYLKFEKCGFCIRKYDLETVKSNSDSLKIDLKIKEGSYAFPGAIGQITGLKENLQSDFDGNIKKTILKNGQNLILQITAVGYESVEIAIDKETTAIQGTLTLNNNWIYEPEIKAFKVVETAKNKLMLSIESKNVIYDKLTKGKAKKKLKALAGNPDIDFYLEHFL